MQTAAFTPSRCLECSKFRVHGTDCAYLESSRFCSGRCFETNKMFREQKIAYEKQTADLNSWASSIGRRLASFLFQRSSSVYSYFSATSHSLLILRFSFALALTASPTHYPSVYGWKHRALNCLPSCSFNLLVSSSSRVLGAQVVPESNCLQGKSVKTQLKLDLASRPLQPHQSPHIVPGTQLQPSFRHTAAAAATSKAQNDCVYSHNSSPPLHVTFNSSAESCVHLDSLSACYP